jgi:catechol 2,3-dioxygenase-like lactoylglutathione lyase family enzyme
MRILNVTITVMDLDAAAAFYREVLGLLVTQSVDETAA